MRVKAVLGVVALGVLTGCPGRSRATAPDAAGVAPGPDSGPVEPCTETALDDVRRFRPCGLGAGVFGRWIVDDYGLPAYEYTLAEERDDRARYPNSFDADRRDHWHQLGNDRVIATAYNEGYVQLLGADRGFTVHNWFEPARGNYAGGFGFIDDGAEVWCTAYRWRPEASATRRVFGMGYVHYVTEHAGLRVSRRIAAPAGDRGALVSDVVVENVGAAPRLVRHYEYWDVNRHPLSFQALRSGSFGRTGDARRSALNAPFEQRVAWDSARGLLRASMRYTGTDAPPSPDAAVTVDSYPRDVYLATLVGSVNDVYTDQSRFFGASGPASPEAVHARRTGEVLAPAPADGQPVCLVARSDATLRPGERLHLRFAYGYLPPGDALDLPPTWSDPGVDPVRATTDAWRPRLAYFASARDPALHREVAWRSYYLQSASIYLDYFRSHTIAQGGGYMFLNGLDGAPRDQALFSLPLVYVHPEAARALLTFVMEMTRSSDGGIAYSYHGHGVLEDALIHAHPSDLDLFLVLALTEYVAATNDLAFLSRHVPFYPPGAALPAGTADDTVIEHLRLAIGHFRDTVGRGPNGLVRVLDGDWNDGISFETGPAARDNNARSGESHPNTAMAAYVLANAADVFDAIDPALAASMRAQSADLLTALRAQWTGRWYPRAWLRDVNDQPVLVGGDAQRLWLETQPWALLANAPDPDQRATLLRELDARLDGPSPIGAVIQEPVVGSEGRAQVWPAITGLLTWAYTRDRPDLAWRSIVRNAYYAHAEAYPEIWSGIWSGPDGTEGFRSSNAGRAWTSLATPMTDYPVMNANPDAMGLLGILRVAGIEPTRGGLRIRPVVPDDRFVLDTELLRVEMSPGDIQGEYRAINDGAIALVFTPGARARVTDASVRGASVTPATNAEDVRLDLRFRAGERVPFALRWR